MSSKVIQVSPRDARLKRRIRSHLRNLGFKRGADGSLLPPSLDKDAYRQFHEFQRQEKVDGSRVWLTKNAGKLSKYFADGAEVVPGAVTPELELIDGGTWQSDLFRLAALYWRVPVSDGYGRRMRFLVWDKSNGKLIGIIALGDAVFNQAARDGHIGWDHLQRGESLVHLMDAYVLGALPPYNMILSGKLIASLLRTQEVIRAFDKKYRDSVGIISGKQKRARLVAITTSSALGRSSVYNRVSLEGRKILEPIGYTSGWGHFHFSGPIFDEIRDYLESVGDEYATGFSFGSGPNWRIRVIRRALERLGMDTTLAKHGFKREVFFCGVAQNAIPFLRGEHKNVQYRAVPTVAEVSEIAKQRWVIPRAEWDHRFREWRAADYLGQLLSEPVGRRVTRMSRDASGA